MSGPDLSSESELRYVDQQDMKKHLVPAGQLHWYDSVLKSFSHAPLFRQNTPPPHSDDANWQEAPRNVAPCAGSCRSSVADHTEIVIIIGAQLPAAIRSAESFVSAWADRCT